VSPDLLFLMSVADTNAGRGNRSRPPGAAGTAKRVASKRALRLFAPRATRLHPELATGIEPVTSSLPRMCSTN
jgi:hypothetical protein